MTVPYAVDYWIKGGFPAHKIALGMATYARAFSLENPKSQNGLAAPTSSGWPAAPKGQFTRECMYIDSKVLIFNEYDLLLFY